MGQASNGNIAALLGSRICHDLISPIGAVRNGLELLSLSGVPQTPELELVSDSAANANARISLFRLAFGLAATDQITRADEICRTWAAASPERALTLDWHAAQSLSRPMAQIMVLALMCLERALPQGGTVRVSEASGHWRLEATGPAQRDTAALWDMLTGGGSHKSVEPAQVQFLLLPHYLAEQGRRCAVQAGKDRITLLF